MGTVSVRRSVGVVRNKGEGAELAEGGTKSGKARVIDLDATTVALLRWWKRERGALALKLARDDALIFGDHEGAFRHPERVSRTFKADVERCRKALGEAAPPVIRLHDLRHTHATLLQMGRVASDASFQRIRERLLPAAQRAALGQARASWEPAHLM